MLSFLQHVSKEARREIVRVMLRDRSQRELAELMGVSPAAVTKYIYGRTHPSDDTLMRLVRSASPRELEEIARIILEDLVEGLISFIDWASERRILPVDSVRSLEEAVGRARLAASSRRLVIET